MRAFAPRAKRARQFRKPEPPLLSSRPRTAGTRASDEGAAIPGSLGSRFQHDFSRVPVSSRPAAASGERAGPAPAEGREWLAITGSPGGPGMARDVSRGGTLPYREATELMECIRIMGQANTAYCRQEVLGEPAGPAVPRLQKTTVSGPTTQNNGGFSWGARWSIGNATSTTDGWIVQHVVVTQNVTDSTGAAVTPGQGGYGGLRTAWYPIWEAWQVRGGQVFVGSSASPHNADTYGQGPVGASTKGTTAVVGRANFYPNLTLPASFTVTNAAPAWSLPVTTTDPALTGGTGALDHNLTATWDGVAGTGATTVTTV